MSEIQKTVFRVSDFLAWQRAGSLRLSPSFQRRPLWPIGAKSFLLDSILKGIPIPIIFLRQRTNLETLAPLREVVDGQQRLRTVLSYIDPTSLSDFDPTRDAFTISRQHNPEVGGKAFKELPEAYRLRILEYDFSVHVLPSDTDDREVLQIFARMNSTGFKLNDQELRNAAWFGVFKDLAYGLAIEQLSRWRQWRVFQETDIARMIEVEETSDLIVTMCQGVHGKTQALLDRYYKDKDAEFPEAPEIARRFREVMDKMDDSFGKEMPTSAFHRRTLFHTLFTFYYSRMFGLGSPFRKVRSLPLPPGLPQALRIASAEITSGDLDEELARVLRGATGHMASRKKRLEYLEHVWQQNQT